MELSFTALAGTLFAPTILFFVLGLIAAFAKSDLSIPEGAAVAHSGIDSTLIASRGAGIVLSFILPFIAYALIRSMTRMDTLNASAVAGHYGSISIVTFVTAVSLLDARSIDSEGYLVAVLQQ